MTVDQIQESLHKILMADYPISADERTALVYAIELLNLRLVEFSPKEMLKVVSAD